jgi:hypothetical protein
MIILGFPYGFSEQCIFLASPYLSTFYQCTFFHRFICGIFICAFCFPRHIFGFSTSAYCCLHLRTFYQCILLSPFADFLPVHIAFTALSVGFFSLHFAFPVVFVGFLSMLLAFTAVFVAFLPVHLALTALILVLQILIRDPEIRNKHPGSSFRERRNNF